MNKLRKLSVFLVGSLLAPFATASTAAMLDSKSLTIDFTVAADAKAKATWSEPDRLSITAAGFGWDGEAASSRDGWIETTPLALGLSWRPPAAVSVRVVIQPEPREFALSSGQRAGPPDAGDVYTRYSADLCHWSTWQVIQASDARDNVEKAKPGRRFTGTIRVPHSEREQYGRLLSDYALLDVPWKSDEDAAVHWIVQKAPDFFAKQLPFIGYIQFRYEGRFYGAQRLTSFKADVSYSVSGLHLEPKSRDAYKDRDARPWSFTAEPSACSPSSNLGAQANSGHTVRRQVLRDAGCFGQPLFEKRLTSLGTSSLGIEYLKSAVMCAHWKGEEPYERARALEIARGAEESCGRRDTLRQQLARSETNAEARALVDKVARDLDEGTVDIFAPEYFLWNDPWPRPR